MSPRRGRDPPVQAGLFRLLSVSAFPYYILIQIIVVMKYWYEQKKYEDSNYMW